MGTEVLRPQDFLAERFRVSPTPFNRRRHYPVNGNGYQKKKFTSQHRQHHHHHEITNSKPIPTPSGGLKPAVTILRRGESLDSLNSKIKKENKRVSSSEKEMKKIDVYAGSACAVSPSPSSLPLPTFFKKQELKSFDDSATRDLRRLLRLE